jgi:hypothetical protein
MYIASEEQQRVINNSSSLSNITYNDQNIALQTLGLQAYNHWTKGESSVIVMPDQSHRESFISMLKEMGLEQLLYTVKLKEAVNEKDLSALRNICQNPNKKNTLEYNEAEHQLQIKLNKSNTFYTNKYNKTIEKKTWREILDLYLMMKPNQNTDILQRGINKHYFAFTPSEMITIREGISDALMIYQRDFEISETLQMHHLLHKNVQHPDMLQEVTHQLFTFKEAAEILRDRFYECHKRLETNYLISNFQRFDALMDDITQMKSHLAFHYAHYKKSSLLDVFSEEQKRQERATKKLLEDWNALILRLSEWQLVELKSYKTIPEDGLQRLEEYANRLQSQKEKKISQKEDFLKSINRFNLNDSLLNDLEYDLSALTNRINESEILSQKLEVNTLSLAKQIDFITDLVYQIEIILLKIDRNNHFYQWTSFVNECSPQVKEVLKHLKIIDPGDWLHAFDTWYYHAILTKEQIHLSSASEFAPNSLLKLYESSIKNEISARLLTHNLAIRDYLTELKKSSPDLHALLLKNKKLSHPTTWKYFLSENNTFFTTLFPIILIDDDHLERFAKQEGQHLMVFNKADINVEILQLFNTVSCYFPKEDFVGSPDLTVIQHQIAINRTLQEITVSERLPLVRSLTDILTSMGNVPEIYQMKDTSIVSFASPYINQIFSRKLYDLGIKKIHIDGSLSETLMGALLDSEKHIYIITEDGLINPKTMDTFIYQIQSIQMMLKAGCELLDIDTSALMRDQDEILQPMIDLIKSNQHQRLANEQKQIRFEFS